MMLLVKKTSISVFKFFFNVMTLCFGGPILGILIGLLFFYWIKRTPKINTLIVSITFINAFYLFFICEYYSWNISGILAVVFSSIILSYKSKLLIIEDNLLEGIETAWQFVHFCLESVLFILTGILMSNEIVHSFNGYSI